MRISIKTPGCEFETLLKFIFNFETPSLIRKIILCASFFLMTQLVFAKSQTFHYLDQTFNLYVNPSKVLFLYGPWGEDPVVVDEPVRQAWGTAAGFGIPVAYQKRDELRWAILDRETGKALRSGILGELSPELGYIDYVVVTASNVKAQAKVVFEEGKFTVYEFDRFGRQKLLRQGKIKGR